MRDIRFLTEERELLFVQFVRFFSVVHFIRARARGLHCTLKLFNTAAKLRRLNQNKSMRDDRKNTGVAFRRAEG